MLTGINPKQTNKRTVARNNMSSVCSGSMEYQRLVQYFEILVRIDKRLKKQNNGKNNY